MVSFQFSVFSMASGGWEFACVFFVARAFQPEFCAVRFDRLCGGFPGCCPLTPDPSPAFHGGEGRISGQWGCRRQEAGLT